MKRAVYQQNPWLGWLYAHGWEGPPPSQLLVSLEAHGFNPQPEPPGTIMDPWRVAVVQILQAAQAKDLLRPPFSGASRTFVGI
jgi:hypothetical protein